VRRKGGGGGLGGVGFRQGLDFAGSFDVDGGELTMELWCPWRDVGWRLMDSVMVCLFLC
jgi:hypothetical protein